MGANAAHGRRDTQIRMNVAQGHEDNGGDHTDTTINKCDSNSDGNDDDNWDGNRNDDGNEDESSDDDDDDDDGSDSSDHDEYGNNNDNNDDNDDNDNDKQTQQSTNATSTATAMMTVTATATTMAMKTKAVMAQTVDSGTIDQVKEQLSLLSQFKDSYVKVQNRIHGQGEDDFDQTAHDLL